VKADRNKQRMQLQLNLYLLSEKLLIQHYPADLFFTLKGQLMRIISHSCLAVQRINAFKAATMFCFKFQIHQVAHFLLPQLYSLNIKTMREFDVRNEDLIIKVYMQ